MSNQTEDPRTLSLGVAVGVDGSPIPIVRDGAVVPYRMSSQSDIYGRGARGIRWFMPYAARISVLEELV